MSAYYENRFDQITDVYFWEDSGHGIHPVARRHLGYGDHIAAVRGELSAQEEVDEEYLPDHIDKVESLTEEESHGVPIIVVLSIQEVINQNLQSVNFN